LSKHPLDEQRFTYQLLSQNTAQEIQAAIESNEKLEFKLMGLVLNIREIISQKGNPYGRFVMLDFSGNVEFNIYGKEWIDYKNLISKDYILLISGSIIPNIEMGGRPKVKFKTLSICQKYPTNFSLMIRKTQSNGWLKKQF
jgi:DNA polymerase-3 subunit alpha